MGDHRSFNDECLAAHNGLRKAHNVGALIYDDKLAKAAQQYAEKIVATGRMEHSRDNERPNQGENLAMSFKPFPNYKYSGRGVSSSWYSEIKDYDFTKETQKSGNPATGHFTQVIWKECTHAGFGRAQSRDKAWYVVGRYSPPGNLIGSFMKNVPKCNYQKWEDVPVVMEYLEELRTWEFTKARKHILDDWSSQSSGKIVNGVKTFTLTENFVSKIYGNYSESAQFPEDPSDLPRPEYKGKIANDFGGNEDNFGNGDEEEERFEEAVLRKHNEYRNKHKVPELELDNKLSEFAQDWAESMADKEMTDLSHYQFNNSELGENITQKNEAINKLSGERLVENWYNEQKYYSYQREPDNFAKVGHFTQVVWKNSTKLGVGYASSVSGKNFIACFYYPAGNVKNQFGQNMRPPAR